MTRWMGGCALLALCAGLAIGQAQAAPVMVKESPIHTIPPDDGTSPPVTLLPGDAPTPAAAPAAPVAATPVAAVQAAAAQAPATPAAAAPVSAAVAAPVSAPAAPAPVVADAAEPATAATPPANGPTQAAITPATAAVAPSAAPLLAALTPVAAPQPVSALSDDERAFFAALGHHVTDAAVAYAGYVRQVSAIDPGFRDSDQVHGALHTGAAYHPDQLQEGLVAYSALLALRDQAFVDGVRAQAQPGLAEHLAASPLMVLQIPGASTAASDILGVLRAHGVALEASGKAITQAAYDVQAQAWSKEPVADPAGLLAAVKAQAAHHALADEASEKALLLSLVAAPHAPAAASAAPPPQVVRGLALAALAILNRTASGEDDERLVAVLLRDPFMADCLKLARMNLNQCLAAAGPHYDEVFCAGEHAVGETARCVSSVAAGAGGTLPGGPADALPAAPRQEAAGYGYPAAASAVAQVAAVAPAQADTYADRWTEHDAPEDAAPATAGQAPSYGDAPNGGQPQSWR